jgi:lipopolysaccharide transport system permease protein
VQSGQNLWSYRSLIRMFAISDLKKRYRNSALGFAWTVLEPLLLLTVLVVVFTNLYKSNPIPHFVLYLLLNLILWQTFARGTNMGVNSILGRGKMISKIYFPREILPISSSITSFLMLLFEFIIFFAFVLGFQFMPPPTILVLPFAVLLEFMLVLGISLALSALNIYYRDIQYIWGVISYAGFFLSPIFYTLDRFTPHERSLILLVNPMADILEMAHNATLYGTLPTFALTAYAVVFCASALVIGFLIFRILEPRLAEEV